MTQGEQDPSSLVDELAKASWTLGAIGAFVDSGLLAALSDPRTLDELARMCPAMARSRIERCLAVVADRGLVIDEDGRYSLAPAMRAYLEPAFAAPLLADVRCGLMQPLVYLDAAQGPPTRGWQHTDRALLEAQGDASSLFAVTLAYKIAPALGDLTERLRRRGGRVLDVGVGVASLAIGLCRQFPELEVLGLDVQDAPLAIARERVSSAGLTGRIELRQMGVETLREEARYDLAWLPASFLPEESIPTAIARVHAALRPGGFLLMPTMRTKLSAGDRTLWSMVLEAYGTVLDAERGQALLREGGFAAPLAMPGPGWVEIIAGQR